VFFEKLKHTISNDYVSNLSRKRDMLSSARGMCAERLKNDASYKSQRLLLEKIMSQTVSIEEKLPDISEHHIFKIMEEIKRVDSDLQRSR
jgi:hypothetical protein